MGLLRGGYGGDYTPCLIGDSSGSSYPLPKLLRVFSNVLQTIRQDIVSTIIFPTMAKAIQLSLNVQTQTSAPSTKNYELPSLHKIL